MNYVTKSQIFSKNLKTINTITTSIGICTKFELYVITDMRHLRCKEKGFENYPKCKIFPCGGQGQGASGRPPEPPAPECILLFFGGFPRPTTPFFPSQRYLSLLLVCLIPTIPMPRPRSGRGLLVYSTLQKNLINYAKHFRFKRFSPRFFYTLWTSPYNWMLSLHINRFTMKNHDLYLYWSWNLGVFWSKPHIRTMLIVFSSTSRYF